MPERFETENRIKTVLKRALCVMTAVLLTGYLFIHVSYMCRGYDKLMSFYGLEENCCDAVFVGTSVTFSSIMPMDLYEEQGIASCVYATNMQFENSLRYSIREVLKTQKPKLLMVDVAPFVSGHFPNTVSEDWTDENRDLFIKFNVDSMRYSPERTALIGEIARARGLGIKKRLYYELDISHYHTNRPDPKHFDNAQYDINRGFQYLSHDAGGKTVPEELGVDDGSAEPLPEPEMTYLKELVDEADRCGTEVRFFFAPVYCFGDTYKRKNFVGQYVASRGYEFRDFSLDRDRIGIDAAADFWGYNHLDSLGAGKATALIGEYLAETADLPDRKGDPGWAYWTEELEKWHIIRAMNDENDRNT